MLLFESDDIFTTKSIMVVQQRWRSVNYINTSSLSINFNTSSLPYYNTSHAVTSHSQSSSRSNVSETISIPSPVTPTVNRRISHNTIINKSTTGFVLAHTISEQMTMAMFHTYQLARVATDWNARMVLPFILRDRLTGTPRGRRTKPLDIIYNVSMFNTISRNYGIESFAEFTAFMRYANRDNVYFFYVYYFGNGGNGPVVEKCSKTKEFSDHRTILSILSVESNRQHYPKQFKYVASRCCIVRSSQPFVPKDFTEGCGIDTSNQFTIIINYWRGYSPSIKKSFRLYAPNYRNKRKVPPLDLPYNEYIEKATNSFVKHLTKGKRFIGVHLRAQKLFLKHKDNKQFNDRKCIHDLISKVKELSSNNMYSDYATVFVGDNHVKKYRELLVNISVSHFNPSDYHILNNDALIAQVEQNTLSQASVLVMCGGGSFEVSIYNRYKKRNPNGVVHKICN